MPKPKDKSEHLQQENPAESLEISALTNSWMEAYEKKDSESMIEISETLLERFPNKSVGFRYLSRSLRYAGQHEQAIDAAQIAVEMEPANPSNHEALAKALKAAGYDNPAAAVARDGLEAVNEADGSADQRRRLRASQDPEERRRIMDQIGGLSSEETTAALAKRLDLFLLLGKKDIDEDKGNSN